MEHRIKDKEIRELVAFCHNTLNEAREMLGVLEDKGGHDGLMGKGLLATLDHIDEARNKTWYALFSNEKQTKGSDNE